MTGFQGVAVALIAVLVLAPTTASANSAARKVSRGLGNMVFGVLAIPGEMVRETNENGIARGLSLGFVFGIGMTVVRELVGVYEVLTCPFEIPEGFEPIIEPEFPWDYFQGV